nr:PREDICTED: uncharacterized protein LOC109029993 [Bemisia tabaci]
MKGLSVIVLTVVAGVALAGPIGDEARGMDNSLPNKPEVSLAEENLMKRLNAKCSQKDTSSCIMLKVITYMNRLMKKSNIQVADNIQITQTANADPKVEQSREQRAVPLNAEDDEAAVGDLISDKLWSFVKTRSFKWTVLPEADVVISSNPQEDGTINLGMSFRTGKALETGRGKMKNLGPIIAAGIMKFGMLGVLAFKALALLVGKALLISKLAFLLAAVIGLKKLFSQQRHVTYEVVAHPHHSDSHHAADTYSSGWGRAINVPGEQGQDATDAHSLAYRAYLKTE